MQTFPNVSPVHDSPCMTPRAWLPVHDSPCMTPRAWLPVHDSPCMTPRVWLPVHDSPCMTPRAWLPVHDSPCMTPRAWLPVHDSPCMTPRAWLPVHDSPCMTPRAWFPVHDSPCMTWTLILCRLPTLIQPALLFDYPECLLPALILSPNSDFDSALSTLCLKLVMEFCLFDLHSVLIKLHTDPNATDSAIHLQY